MHGKGNSLIVEQLSKSEEEKNDVKGIKVPMEYKSPSIDLHGVSVMLSVASFRDDSL